MNLSGCLTEMGHNTHSVHLGKCFGSVVLFLNQKYVFVALLKEFSQHVALSHLQKALCYRKFSSFIKDMQTEVSKGMN